MYKLLYFGFSDKHDIRSHVLFPALIPASSTMVSALPFTNDTPLCRIEKNRQQNVKKDHNRKCIKLQK